MIPQPSMRILGIDRDVLRVLVVLFYIISIILIVVLFVTVYFSAVEFIYSSFYFIIIQILEGLIVISTCDSIKILQKCLWQIFCLPVVEVMLTISLHFVWAFFTTRWDVISYQGLGCYLGTELRR
jgi:hypothetical protein